jgi:HK97 family phage major capsid protein
LNNERLAQLHTLRNRAIAERSKIIQQVQNESRSNLTLSEEKRFREAVSNIKSLDEQIADGEEARQRSGRYDPEVAAITRATSTVGDPPTTRQSGDSWAKRAAAVLQQIGGESRAIASGSVDVPVLVDPAVTPKSRPTRLIDLLVNRSRLNSAAFEYLRQTVRTINAAPVADQATKPTSVFTLAPIIDRARVLAHLSEPFPIRYFQDSEDVVRWLEVEMREGVLTALESQVISGSGSGENMVGVLNVSGTTAVSFATDVPTTLRKAITALQTIGVTPTAWAINPADAEALDLLKEGTGGVGFLLDGVQNGTASSANVFGDTAIQRVISPSVPTGTAILADWNAIRLYVREQMRLDIDAGGDHFAKNEAVMRAEIRVGLGHLHPASFAVADLTA